MHGHIFSFCDKASSCCATISMQPCASATSQPWKEAQFIVLPKPGKPLHDLASCWLISLLLIIGKMFEKLLQAKIESHITIKGKIPDLSVWFPSQSIHNWTSSPRSCTNSEYSWDEKILLSCIPRYCKCIRLGLAIDIYKKPRCPTSYTMHVKIRSGS